MITVLRQFKKALQPELKQYGFICYYNYFYRVINDVFQGFGLEKTHFRSYRICFTIHPLCTENPLNRHSCGSATVFEFEGKYGADFEINSFNKESVSINIAEMMRYMHTYLFPFFEQGTDSETAYSTIYRFQKEHCSDVCSIYDSDYFYFSLKLRWYDKALEHLNAMKMQNENAYRRNCRVFEMPQSYHEQHAKEMNDYAFLEDKILQKDERYIQTFLNNNEQANRKRLRV